MCLNCTDPTKKYLKACRAKTNQLQEMLEQADRAGEGNGTDLNTYVRCGSQETVVPLKLAGIAIALTKVTMKDIAKAFCDASRVFKPTPTSPPDQLLLEVIKFRLYQELYLILALDSPLWWSSTGKPLAARHIQHV